MTNTQTTKRQPYRFGNAGPWDEMTPDNIMGWIDRNPFYEPSHVEGAMLAKEIMNWRDEADRLAANYKELEDLARALIKEGGYAHGHGSPWDVLAHHINFWGVDDNA